MKKRNISDINKFLIENDEIKEYNNSQNTLKTEGNQFINTPPQNNKNNLLSNSKYMKANYNTVKNKTQNKNKQLINKSYLDMIKYIEEELGSLDSEKHIKSAVKILENFQNELIGQLEQEYDENNIKKVLQTNFDKIIKLLIKYFTLYDNKCANCIINIKKMLKNILTVNNNNHYNNSQINSDGKVTNKSYKYNYNSVFDEEKKKEFLNGEEIIVGLINSLSGGIKNCNKNYRTTVINMAKLVEESNNSLIEIKSKLDNLNIQIKSKYNNEIQYKKNLSVSVINITTDIENLYAMNCNIIEDVKIIDSNQNSFYEEAKEIFNHLKINHNKKLKEYHMFFESISHMQTNANSLSEFKKRGNSFSGNKIYNEKNNNEKIMVRNNSSKKFSPKKNNKETEENNFKNINIVTFAIQVSEFFNKMKNLQESIIKKLEGTNQMKIEFERYKKKLIKLVNFIINNKIKSNDVQINLIKQRKDDDFINENNNRINFEIIQVENFKLISKIKKNDKSFEISEMQIKYNNLLEEINKKSQEINQLQDKINNIQLENNKLKRNTNNNKLSNNINFKDINKINEEIISPLNNNSINSISDQINSNNENLIQLKQENKKIKGLMNKCVQIIFDTIKETSPNMVEDNFISDESEDKIKNEKNNLEDNEQEEEFDIDYITEAVKKFQNYNIEMAKNLKKVEEEKEKYEKQAHENSVKAEAYKNALDQAINKINQGDEANISDVNNKSQNKKNISFEGEGEISFKDNYNNNINQKHEKEEIINPNIMNDNNINDLNQLLVNNSNDEDNKEEKDNKENNEDTAKVNKDLLKIQQNLIEKIKTLEEEIEKNKLTMHNLFIESGNDLYDDINEMSVPMTKYNGLLKLLESEQERNKNLEEKYLAFINEITQNITLNKNEIENISNKLNFENNEYENNKNRNNNKINKNRTYGELNVHNDNYLSLLNKNININGDEEENENENNFQMKKENNELYNNLKIQEILEENKDLREKESLLSTQLITIKQELKETRLFLEDTKRKNLELTQEIESQGTLRNQNLIGSLRNCLERLITEIKINAKIKEILIVLLRLASYTEEQIETIFKYKDKKKNIINIFQI
jgi:hypothetical protein